MNRNSGFALIASLIIMVVLTAMGFGAMFLTQMNLRIAENSRTSAIARYNAEAGLDSSFVLLAGAFQANEEIPADITEMRSLFPTFENAEYGFAPSNGYTVFGDGTARIRIIGYGPNNAKYEAEALVKPLVQPVPGGGGYSLFAEGFVAKEDINMNGNGIFDMNFWSGGNINLGAATLLKGRTGRAAGTTCTVKKGEGTCASGQKPPDVPLPVFDTLRNEIIDSVIEQDPTFSMDSCTYKTGVHSASNTVICVPSGGSLTLTGNLTNLVVIGDQTTSVHIDGTMGSTTDDEIPGLTLVSRSISFGGAAEFYGTNTIVAKNDLDFGKNIISHDETARTFIVTEGNFVLNGTGATDMFAVFWVGGRYEVNGTPDRFRGTVVANRTIIKNGGGSFSTVSTPKELDNRFIPTDPEPDFAGAGLTVLSRR